MQLRLHANATTTPRTRAYIQQSAASPAALARELGIHPRTVARWKARPDVADRSTRPHRLATAISQWEEALIVELRRSLALPLDDIVEAMRRLPQPQPVAQRHPSLPQAPRPVRPPDPATGAGRRLPNRHPGRLHPYRCQLPAAAGPPAQLRL